MDFSVKLSEAVLSARGGGEYYGSVFGPWNGAGRQDGNYLHQPSFLPYRDRFPTANNEEDETSGAASALSKRLLQDNSTTVTNHPYEYYNNLRTDTTLATFANRTGNVDVYVTNDSPKQEQLGLCHMVGLYAYSSYNSSELLRTRGSDPYKDMVAALMAAEHFNTGNGAIVPELKGINESCPVRMTSEYLDTEFSIFKGLQELVDVVSRDPESTNEDEQGILPCTILGTHRSGVTTTTVSVSSVHDLAQMSFAASTPELNDPNEFPYFGRVLPSSDALAYITVLYLSNLHLDGLLTQPVKHVAVVFINDEYGLGYSLAFQEIAALEGIRALPVPIELADMDRGVLRDTLSTIAARDYRYVVAAMYTDHYEDIMTAAYDVNITGPDFSWTWVGDGLLPNLLRTSNFAVGSPLHNASVGLGILQEDGTRPGTRGYDAFLKVWESYTDGDIQYFNSKVPPAPELGLDGRPTGIDAFFTASSGFFQSELPGVLTAFAYDTVVALGLAACNATAQSYNTTAGRQEYFRGEQHAHSITHATPFNGVTGLVKVNETTRSRIPTTTAYTLWNVRDEMVGSSSRKSSSFDVLESGSAIPNDDGTDWTFEEGVEFIYASGTTTPPLPLPPHTTDENYLGYIVIFGYIVLGIIVGMAIGFAAWTFWQRNNRVVRASHPAFLYMLCLGPLILGASIIPMGIDDETFSWEACTKACNAIPWLIALGNDIIFAAIFSKTWLVNQIIKNPVKYRRVKIRNRDIMRPLCLLVGINVVILIFFSVYSPLKWDRWAMGGTDNFGRPFETVGGCVPTNDWIYVFFVLIGLVNFTALGLSWWQTYLARDLKTEFGESKYIGLVLMTLLQAYILGVPLLILVTKAQVPSAIYLVRIFVVGGSALAVLAWIFIPKIIANKKLCAAHAQRKADMEALRQQRIANGESTGDLGDSITDSDDGHDGLKVVMVDTALVQKKLMERDSVVQKQPTSHGAPAGGDFLQSEEEQIDAFINKRKAFMAEAIKDLDEMAANSQDVDDQREPDVKYFTSWKEWAAGILGFVSAVLNGGHIAVLATGEPKNMQPKINTNATKGVGYAASGFGLLLAPYAIFNETQLAQEGSLRKVLNSIRNQVNRFGRENEKLSENISRVERSVNTMQDVEQALTVLTKNQGTDLEFLMELLRENRIISNKMRELLKAKAVEDVITVVLNADKDGSFKLEGKEIDELIMSLKLMEDIELDEVAFRQRVIDCNGDVLWVLQMVKDMLEGEESCCLKVAHDPSLMDANQPTFLSGVRRDIFSD